MDLYELKAGDQVRTVDGAVAEVLKETQDGKWILVRYLEAQDSDLPGTEDLCHVDELSAAVETTN